MVKVNGKLGRFLEVESKPEVVDEVISNLMLDNPAYANAKKLGYSTYNIPPKLKLYSPIEGGYCLPRAYVPRTFGVDIVEDSRVLAPMQIPFKGTLRPYQKDPVERMLLAGDGVLVAPTGSGKTVMGLKIASGLGHKTMVLVHKKILLDQWVDRVQEFCGIQAGIVGDGKVQNTDSPIVIGMVQTLVKSGYEKHKKFFDSFGLVIGDECHRHGAAMWQRAINLFPAYYRIGLSATPYRTDGLDDIIFWNFGPIKHDSKPRLKAKVIQKEIAEGGEPQELKYLDVLKDFVYNSERNGVIINDAVSAVSKGRFVLILTRYVDHVELLYTGLKMRLPGRVARLYGAVQEPIMPKTKVIIGTFAYLKEGVDIPELDSLIYALPVVSEVDLAQSAGRILRSHPDKHSPLIMDYVDTCLKNTASKRAVAFTKLGFSVEKRPLRHSRVELHPHWLAVKRRTGQ